MNKEAQKWLHEADVNIERVEKVFTLTGSITLGDAEILYKQGYEYSLKAPLAEKYNGIPSSYHSHPLTVLSKQYGLFDLFTLELQQSLADMDRHFPIRRIRGLLDTTHWSPHLPRLSGTNVLLGRKS